MEEKQPAETVPVDLPPGVRLVRTLRGHTGVIYGIAWSPDGRMLASSSDDATIRLWNADAGECLRTLEGFAFTVAFDPKRILATGSDDGNVSLWSATLGQLLRTLTGHEGWVRGVAFDPTGCILASGSSDGTVKLWDRHTGELLHSLKGHNGSVRDVAFNPAGRTLASAGYDRTVRLWEIANRRLLRTLAADAPVFSVAFDPAGRTLASGGFDGTVKLWEAAGDRLLGTLEGHAREVQSVAFSCDGRLLASKGADSTIRLWWVESGSQAAVISEPTGSWSRSLAFHPRLPLLATVGSDPDASQPERGRLIHIWELDLAALRKAQGIPTSHYVNAKVVLLGDTGVGKSGLSLVLNGEPFRPTESTAGRTVWTFQSQEVETGPNLRQTRETLLWDLAGQPGYRIIHQLHLNEVAVALIVFDARSETDPLAGVTHWERALRLAQQRQGASSVPLKKFLVSARTDRGIVPVSRERLETLLRERGFAGYFETSAKEGLQIEELRQAIEQAVPWNELPVVSSSVLFTDIKAFLMEAKQTGRLVARAAELYEDFARTHSDAAARETNLRDQFETCISRLENRDLIRGLSFGGYVLLQPELLDAYASAMVNAAKEEPDGLGSIAEDAALAGRFFVPREQRVGDRGQEQLLLHATVEELARHDLALRESAADGRYLVFPSQFNRDYEDAPDPKGKAVAITFTGPVQNLYSTLAVRLGHSDLFTTTRAEMWRNAAIFTARAGGKCGLYVQEFAEASGRLIVFYDQHEGRRPSDETRFHFENFILAYLQGRSLDGAVDVVRFFVCSNGHPVPDEYVKLLRDQGKRLFACPCGVNVSLEEPEERLRYAPKVEVMEQSANRQRALEVFVASARGEMSTPPFGDWAGDEHVMLAIVFTDIVGSAALGEELKNERWNELRRAHFTQNRMLIDKYKGRAIKTIGDSFMAAFRSVHQALDYAMSLHAAPGHAQVQVRAGIHIGPMTIEENDVFGGAVNFAARVVGKIKGAEIWLSDRAKAYLDESGAKPQLKWTRHDGIQMKGFPGSFTLWSLNR